MQQAPHPADLLRGKQGEQAFKSWLDRSMVPFVYIEQSAESRAEKLVRDIKRPDYFVAVPAVGLVAVDVKVKTLYGKNEFYIDEADIIRMNRFEKYFATTTWLAIYPAQDETLSTCFLYPNQGLLVEPKVKNKQGKNCVALKANQMLAVQVNQEDFLPALCRAISLS